MKTMRLAIVTFLFSFQAYSQLSAQTAQPAIGWDSLKSLIAYPEIAKRAGLQGYVDVAAQIDTVGNVGEVTVCGIEIFHQPIREAVRKVKWLPEIYYGSKRSAKVFFEIQFKLKQSEMPKRTSLLIEADEPIILRNH